MSSVKRRLKRLREKAEKKGVFTDIDKIENMFINVLFNNKSSSYLNDFHTYNSLYVEFVKRVNMSFKYPLLNPRYFYKKYKPEKSLVTSRISKEISV